MNCIELYHNYLGGIAPYPHQQEVFNKLREAPEVPLLVRAPTGSGKTEAAVAPFLSQFISGQWPLAPRLIYVLPTQALCNQMHERLQQYALEVDNKLKVGLHHGAHPREPMFFADIVVTTLDQFIYGYARASSHVGRHVDIPAGSIAGSVVVFDEAHMYHDPFTFAMLRAIIEILHEARVPTVTMTATMPPTLENDLFDNTGRDLILYKAPPDAKRKINLRLVDTSLLEGEDLSPDAWQALDDSRRVLIVCNTVKRAQAAYAAVCKRLPEASPILIHSRFTTADRRRLEGDVQARLDRFADGGIVVTTQVCEAGLDISADVVLTEIAPADSLVQRAGRCARWGGEGNVVVFEADPPPYEAKFIEATRAYLQNHPHLDLTDWQRVCDFVAVLNYHADPVAARDSLLDLYDATLFADRQPGNIAVRDGKPVQVFVGTEKDLQDAASIDRFRDHLITLDYRWASYRLKELVRKKGGALGEVEWEQDPQNAKKRPLVLAKGEGGKSADLQPFRTYLLGPEHYDSQRGVITSADDGRAG